MSSFHVEVVTPAGGVVLDREAKHLQLPGEAGSFGILAGHADMMASLGTGIAELQNEAGASEQFTVSGGFAQVHAGRVTVLAESAELPGQIDLDRAEAARERAAKRLAMHNAETDIDRVEMALVRAMNRIKLASRKS